MRCDAHEVACRVKDVEMETVHAHQMWCNAHEVACRVKDVSVGCVKVH